VVLRHAPVAQSAGLHSNMHASCTRARASLRSLLHANLMAMLKSISITTPCTAMNTSARRNCPTQGSASQLHRHMGREGGSRLDERRGRACMHHMHASRCACTHATFAVDSQNHRAPPAPSAPPASSALRVRVHGKVVAAATTCRLLRLCRAL
jgi:hypothetical protein